MIVIQIVRVKNQLIFKIIDFDFDDEKEEETVKKSESVEDTAKKNRAVQKQIINRQ